MHYTPCPDCHDNGQPGDGCDMCGHVSTTPAATYPMPPESDADPFEVWPIVALLYRYGAHTHVEIRAVETETELAYLVCQHDKRGLGAASAMALAYGCEVWTSDTPENADAIKAAGWTLDAPYVPVSALYGLTPTDTCRRIRAALKVTS